MILNPRRHDSELFRETLVVIALTMVGAVIRLWSLGHIGLVHFDEGIYALAGLWVFSPRGLLGLDPNLIAYAPPGFAFLVGLSYLFFGVGDVAAVVVSIAAGTLTIPAVGWVSRRTFGRGAGAAAAAFAAFSGAHIAFSRMALVDASSLLFWVLAIGQGQRFLERPGPSRAVVLGFAVGIAQLFKYSGWVSGVIVPLSAGLWLLFHPGERKSRATIATWGWGLSAALVAALVYWPWYQFVETHGGYSALLAHQRSYLGGSSSWPGHWWVQLDQAVSLSGGPVWWCWGGIAAAVAMLIGVGDFGTRGRVLVGIPTEAMVFAVFCLNPNLSWWFSPIWLCASMIKTEGMSSHAAYLLLTGWFTLSLLTPFYHPYARLWLPIQALGWIICGGASVMLYTNVGRVLSVRPWTWTRTFPVAACLWSGLVCCALQLRLESRREAIRIGPVAHSDSVRLACRAIQKELPNDVKSLRVFARRPVTFYLALGGGVAVFPQPDLKHLLEQGDRTSWALLDMALMRQDNVSEADLSRLLVNWIVIREFPTTLNMATLLDIEPAAARSGTLNVLASLRLLRPKRAGEMP